MPVLEIKEVEEKATLGIWEVQETVKELEEMLPVLAATERYKSFNHNLRRLEWLGARALMREMNISWDLCYSEHGKPFYPDGPKISLTHSKKYIAIIIHPEREVGIDVQEIVPKVERIKHKYCNAHELTWAHTVADYTTIWSAKEAIFKIKERNVHFKEDIQVGAPTPEGLPITFREKQPFIGYCLHLEGYKSVYAVE